MLAVSMGSATASVPPGAPSVHERRLAEVVERARGGDPEAFGYLYHHYQSSVYRVVYAQTRSTPLTEDLTAETFFRALRGITGFKLEADLFAPWLYRIARNLVIDHFKSSRTRLERVEDMSLHEEVVDGADSDILVLLTRDRLRAAVAGLSDGQRRVIEMRFLGELSVAETADVLDTSEGAVKQLQFRGLRNLARTMRD